jgi:hypothetical protein
VTAEELIKAMQVKATEAASERYVPANELADYAVLIAQCEAAVLEVQELRAQGAMLDSAKRELQVQSVINTQLREVIRSLRADIEKMQRDFLKRAN